VPNGKVAGGVPVEESRPGFITTHILLLLLLELNSPFR
jgi:hypothetical protein